MTVRINLDRQQKLYLFGHRLKKLREALEVDGYPMTQKYLAEDTGLSQGAIHQYEAGIKILTVDALVCIYHAFRRIDPTMTLDRILGVVDADGNRRICEVGEFMYNAAVKRRT
jgi:transcriptional regulator with XRE-family HTH domain